MADLNETPSANRVRIAFFGLRNAGKSTLVNAFADQPLAIVSDVPGTTTDPVSKAMEILPLGPCLVTDTAGLDDDADALGRLRVKKSLAVLETTDIAVWVDSPEDNVRPELRAAFLDRCAKLSVTALDYRRGESVDSLKARVATAKVAEAESGLLDGFVWPGQSVLLVCPIDASAPKGRLILPQVQVLRACLDIGVSATVCQPADIPRCLAARTSPFDLVITDSQAFAAVDAALPRGQRLTSFSILFARQKGDVAAYVKGLKALAGLRDGDVVLVAEGCTHRRQCNDIGTVKIPRALERLTGRRLEFRFSSGGAFPLDGVSLVVQCGGCMLTRRETRRRIARACEAGVPIVNYGMVLARAAGLDHSRCELGVVAKASRGERASARRCGALAALALSAALALGAAAGTRVTVGSMKMTTYPFSDPDPVPATSETRYPYFRYDGSTDTPVERSWKTVVLENDQIRVTLLPTVGGKVWAATDKVARRDFLYCNHVMKFRDIAMRGPWVSGGIEYNFGIIGHAPSSSTPVDWLVRTNADGSASCFISSPEYITRTLWQVEVRLGAEAESFETRVNWYNASGLPAPLYHWMNAAYSLRGNPEFKFPGSTAIGHQGEIDVREWPVDDQGRDLSIYKNNAFGGPKSYHVLPGNNGFYAIWWPERGYGSYHRSLGYEKFGRKIWLWALSRAGGIWEDLLTDADGQYTELQSGLCFNQPRLGNYKTPFKHPTFAPGATMTFAESWGPIRNLKDVEKDLLATQPQPRPVDPPAQFDWSSAWGHYVRGVQYLRERGDRKGAKELRQALVKDPDLAPAYGALAEYEMRRANYEMVHALAARALAIDAYDAEANYLDGFAHFAEGDQTTARERLGVAALSPGYAAAALALIGRSYMREGRKAAALEAARKALRHNPDNLDALLTILIADRGDEAFRQRVIERFPLFHAARYESEGGGMWRLIKNELPTQTYLDLAVWYAETGLVDDAKDLYSYIGDSMMARIFAGDYAAAKKLSVAYVFPFRREELAALKQAVASDGHWKFRYLLAVLSAYFDYDEQADELLNGCGDAPNEAVFYLYRASRRKGTARLADLRRARDIKDSWRIGRMLAQTYEEQRDYESMLRETSVYLARNPERNPIQIAHARALLKTGHPQECLDFLATVKILPSEHSDSATDIWHAAQDALGQPHTWPENLGKGKPYDDAK